MWRFGWPFIKHYKWHLRDAETLKQRAGILLETSLHKICAPHNKPLKCPYYIMYYDFKSADISGCCTLISKPNGLFRPSNSCSGWLWSSWWIRPTSISSKKCLIPDQSFWKNWFGFSGLTVCLFFWCHKWTVSLYLLSAGELIVFSDGGGSAAVLGYHWIWRTETEHLCAVWCLIPSPWAMFNDSEKWKKCPPHSNIWITVKFLTFN